MNFHQGMLRLEGLGVEKPHGGMMHLMSSGPTPVTEA